MECICSGVSFGPAGWSMLLPSQAPLEQHTAAAKKPMRACSNAPPVVPTADEVMRQRLHSMKGSRSQVGLGRACTAQIYKYFLHVSPASCPSRLRPCPFPSRPVACTPAASARARRGTGPSLCTPCSPSLLLLIILYASKRWTACWGPCVWNNSSGLTRSVSRCNSSSHLLSQMKQSAAWHRRSPG